MSICLYHLKISIWVLVFLSERSSVHVVASSNPWCPHQFVRQSNRKFEQKSDRFWGFKEEFNRWDEVELPYDLISCVNDNCSKVGVIEQRVKGKKEYDAQSEEKESLRREAVDGTVTVEEEEEEKEKAKMVSLPQRKSSLTRISETSIWVSGESGSIYERFWNGVQWAIAPHDLPISEGPAISIFPVNQTILALSESGFLYQMHINENSQPIWVDFRPVLDHTTNKESVQTLEIRIRSGVVSHDGMRIYFCTKNSTLLELAEMVPPRWVHHGRPPGADVAAIADPASIRPDVVYTISSSGDLYEYDKNSRPVWKKHIWRDKEAKNPSLMPIRGCTSHGLVEEHSISLFLLTKGGNLVERCLHRRKWKWIIHGSPKDHHLTSIALVLQDGSSSDHPQKYLFSLFLTSSFGSVFEYRIPSTSGDLEPWVNHEHPLNAKVARAIPGLQFQNGRILFALDDGRLSELHLTGLGGENLGPTQQNSARRKPSLKYVWSILDAPESEGWNAEYCTEDRGPSNCIAGMKDDQNELGIRRSSTRRPKGSQLTQQSYLIPESTRIVARQPEEDTVPENWTNKNFRLRVMHNGRSFFYVTENGFTFEYLYGEEIWLWLRHESSTPVKGAVGNYNGSLFLVDTYGSLLIRERSNNELTWVNCTAFRKGKQVISGPPWDKMPGPGYKVTDQDAIFFVSKTGRLLRFTVALRKFKWKDCGNPPETKVAGIIDQEIFRDNIVFVVGKNGQLYQYNKVTELWHKHFQSQHLILSRLPGIAMRTSSLTLSGSLFMISVDGGLIEYHWNTWDGWDWVEHGFPGNDVKLVGAPGPCFEGNQLFLIGSDGRVYLRHVDQTSWKWKDYGFPYSGDEKTEEEVCLDEEKLNGSGKYCDPKVASTRPIQFTENTVIFELRDERLAEMQQVEDTNWVWSRIIGTPTSLCGADYWTSLAS